MYIVAWSINHGSNDIEDFWLLFVNRDFALMQYNKVLPDVHCALMAEVEDPKLFNLHDEEMGL